LGAYFERQEYEDRKLCGFKLCYLLNFVVGPVIQRFEFINDRIRATQMLYYFSGEQLCAHIGTDELALGSPMRWVRTRFGNGKKDLAGRIDLEYLQSDLDVYVKRLEKKGHFIKDAKRKFIKAGASIHDTIDPQGALQRRSSANASFGAHSPLDMRAPAPKVKSAVDAASSAAADQSLHACSSDVRV
tara:strand:- start:319 stop:879 length:561 start_codon:yes stop_codon:yes gene_type:complete